VYDALIWGLLCAIIDTPELLRSNQQGAGGGAEGVSLRPDDEYEDLRLERAGRKSRCCS
jgi:hypothetical protein